MDPVQQQILDLSQKVEATHQAIERLYRIVTEVLLEVREGNSHHALENGKKAMGDSARSLSNLGLQADGSSISINPFHHKDVLEDDEHLEGELSGQSSSLAPDMQVRRLTAQLTAAYNRIAALEEQLLSQRVYPSTIV
jgi:hypothetical protein